MILEAFHTSQIGKDTGGPQSIQMLLDEKTLKTDFAGLEVILLEELTVNLNEGPFHQGEAQVIRYLGKKKA